MTSNKQREGQHSGDGGTGNNPGGGRKENDVRDGQASAQRPSHAGDDAGARGAGKPGGGEGDKQRGGGPGKGGGVDEEGGGRESGT